MNQVLFEVAIILLLLVANGIFAMAEIAVVSSKRGRLRVMADQGSKGAKAALDLAESPNRFLSTVQVGITLVGIFAGAYGGATLAAKLAVVLSRFSAIEPYADKIALVLVVAAITYMSLILGELVPKRVGLRNPERVAARVAIPMNWLATAAGPLVTFLSASTDGILRLVGFKMEKEAAVSEDEVKVLMQEGVRAGAFHNVESQIVHQALELDLLEVREIMTPRPKVIWLNESDPHDKIWHKIVVSNHSNYPVYEGDRDHVVGIVTVKAIYANVAAGVPVVLKNLAVPPLVVPASQKVLQLVETFKRSGKHVAVAADEFGSIVGLVSLHDVMEAIIGELPSLDARSKPAAKKREDGTWLIDGMLDIESVAEALPEFLVSENTVGAQTLAGYMMKVFGHVPSEGEQVVIQGYNFEVLDMDRHRIDKVLVVKQGTPSASRSGGPA